jgi:hypothetical protein
MAAHRCPAPERPGNSRLAAGLSFKCPSSTHQANSRRAARTVPLNLTVRKALRGWLLLDDYQPDDPLFTSRSSGHLTARGVQKMIEEVGRRAGGS